MSIQLVKFGTTDQYSAGDNTDPTTLSRNLNDSGSPATQDSDVEEADIRATTYNYTGISLSIQSEEAGIDYKLSLNGVNYFNSLASGSGGDATGEIPDMGASGTPQTKKVYIKAVIANDGSVSSGNHTAPKIRLNATENQ